MIPRSTLEVLSFAAFVLLVTAAFVWLLLPYYGAVLWAVILAVLFSPLQRWLEVRLGGRRNLAAGLSLLVCVCIVVIPGTAILTALAQEAAALYTRISTRGVDLGEVFTRVQAALPQMVLDGLAYLNLGEFSEIQARLTAFLLQASQAIASRAMVIGQNTAQFLIALGLMIYMLFFLFRDGPGLIQVIRRASPLSPHHTDHVMARFVAVIKATVRGNIIIAIIQGGLGGLAFWVLGIEGALLWAVLMSVLSLLPAVGTFLVWGPMGVWLLLSGDVAKGVSLLLFGTLIISVIDNLLRPPLVGRGARLPDYVVLVSTVGGLTLMGVNGFVVGPLIAALFVAVWSLFTDESRPGDGRSGWMSGGDAPPPPD